MAIFITGDLFRYRNKSPYLDVRIIPIDCYKTAEIANCS